MPRLHDSFEWDPAKDKANLIKHRVSFTEAARVLADPEGERFHLEAIDDRHEEERWITLASHPDLRSLVLVIVWTPRGSNTRIVSARAATRKEKLAYEKDIQNRQES